MAGNGPPPKDPKSRRRTNDPARGEWIDLEAFQKGERAVLPALPKRKGGWSARTRDAWRRWRKDPATKLYGESEIQSAIDLAYLHHDWSRGESKLAAEIRLRMDGLGLTPKGKRDLRWRVPPPALVLKLDEAREERAPASKRRLRAVDPAASGG